MHIAALLPRRASLVLALLALSLTAAAADPVPGRVAGVVRDSTGAVVVQATVVLLTGEQSPTHLHERSAVLAAHLRHPSEVRLSGQGHGANTRAPREVARVIADAADRCLR